MSAARERRRRRPSPAPRELPPLQVGDRVRIFADADRRRFEGNATLLTPLRRRSPGFEPLEQWLVLLELEAETDDQGRELAPATKRSCRRLVHPADRLDP